MPTWVTLSLLVLSLGLFLLFYIPSLQPAPGDGGTEATWRRCRTRERTISLVALAAHLVLFFSLAHGVVSPGWLQRFPWPSVLSSLLGIALLVSAAYHLLTGLRAAGRRTLVVGSDRSLFGGAYLRRRHPQFLGFGMFLSASALLSNSPLLLIVSLGWGVILLRLVAIEDRNLETTLGETYREYRGKTRAFLSMRRTAEPRELARCLNCGEELKGEYCHVCGQKGTEFDVPLRELIREFLRDELKIDTRLNRTIVPFLVKPGLLTVEYIAGRRIRYVPPLRMYVFVSLIMFFLLALAGRNLNIERTAIQNEKGAGSAQLIDETIAELKGIDRDDATASTASSTVPVARPRSSPEKAAGFFGRLGRAIAEGATKAQQEPKRLVELAVERFAHIMFLLLPLFALLLKGLYIRSGRHFMQHMIFSLHVHAFAFLVISLILALNLWGNAFCRRYARHLFWLVPLYLFLAMKRFYRQGVVKTSLKFALLTFTYGILFVIGVAVAFVFSLPAM